MKLTLISTNKTHDYTEGKLFLNNNPICDTLEDVIRDINDNGVFDNGEAKQYGKTAIMSDTYDLVVHYSNSLQRDVVMLLNVPEFTYIYLHWGATVKNTLGCILVGKKENNGRLRNIGMTDFLVEKLKEAGGHGTITILR